MFFRIPQLSRLVESFLRQRSMRPETVLNAYKAVFHVIVCSEKSVGIIDKYLIMTKS